MGEIKINAPALDLGAERYAAFLEWKEKWNDYVMISELDKKPKQYQAAILRYTFSPETRKIYSSLGLTAAEKEDPESIIPAIETFAKGIINETLERHLFNNRKQEEGERFDDFMTELKVMVTNCNYCINCLPGILRDRVVGGILNDEVRKELLAKKDLDLDKAIEVCRSNEVAVVGMGTLRNNREDEINRVGATTYNPSKGYTNQNQGNRYNQKTRYQFQENQNDQRNDVSCKFCLRNHQFGRKFCKAWAKRCNDCNMMNHFPGSAVCRNSTTDRRRADEKGNAPVNRIVAEERDEIPEHLGALFIGSVEAEVNTIAAKRFELEVKAKNGVIKFKIDTGADVTVIGADQLEVFGLKKEQLKKNSRTLTGPDHNKLKCIGYFSTDFKVQEKNTQVIVYVCENIRTALLGRPALEDLQLVQIDIPSQVECSSVDKDSSNEFIEEFPKLFTGLGKIEGEPIKIKMAEGITPYHLSAPRRVALPLLKPLEEELQRMETLGVIRKVSDPTDWCHPMVVVVKPETKKLRICLDLTKLNEGVKREYHQLPKVDETLAKIGGEGIIFTKLDANSGYWQMPLDEESQLKATFITPFGRFCPTRGPFGLTSMPEIFSKRMDQLIEGISGIVKSMDDFLIFGKTVEEHDERLRKVLKTMQDQGMTLNKDKCLFRLSQVEFLGHLISKEGIQPIKKKVDAIINFRKPSNITELRSFLGMAQQLSKFNAQLANVSAPLRDLLSSKNAWLWTPKHDEVFQKVKEILSSPATLAMYDVKKPTKIRTDGSKLHGISVILLQQHGVQWRVVDCASRFLSATEKNYAPIEIEMLAVAWGVNRMAMYLHGLPEFVIETDHKPLIPILNYKQLIEMSPRILRLRMKLLQYRFLAKYIPGKELVDADAMSRAPVEKPKKEDEMAENEITDFVNQIISQLPATEERLDKIKLETCKDETLKQVVWMVQNGWPKQYKQCTQLGKPYWKHRGDICYIDGLLLKGDRIIIPKVLRRDILDKIHEGHLGMEKCKRRAKQSVFWPCINNEIELKSSKCRTCMKMLPSKEREELKVHELPTRPWQKVGTDLFQYGGKHYLIVADYYSFWPEVYLLRKPDAEQVIEVTKDAFARHGVAQEVMSDNGPQYSSHKYKLFSKDWQFKHTTSSPHYAQSNGLAESAVKSVKRMIKKCTQTGTDIKKGLLIIRNTPLKCGKSPAELLLGHQLRDNLPTIPSKFEKTVEKTEEVKKRDLPAERREAKFYYDNKLNKSKTTQLFKPQQRVVIQNENTREWDRFGQIVDQVEDRSYNVKMANGKIIRRNRKHIRKLFFISSSICPERKEIDEDDTVGYNESFETYGTEDESGRDYEELEDTIEYGREEMVELNDSTQEEENNEADRVKNNCSTFGRMLKKKTPTDYEDL